MSEMEAREAEKCKERKKLKEINATARLIW